MIYFVDTLIAYIHFCNSEDGALIEPRATSGWSSKAATCGWSNGTAREDNSDNKPGCSSFLDITTVPQRPKRSTQKNKKWPTSTLQVVSVSLISDATQKSDAKKLKWKNPSKSLAKNETKNLSAWKGKNVTPKTVLKSKKRKEKCDNSCS